MTESMRGGVDLFGMFDAGEIPAVCPGCGCTMADACVMIVGYDQGETVHGGCRWVETEDGIRCSGCVWPEDRERGPVEDHRAEVSRTPLPVADKAWEGICQGCGAHCALFEQVEFICGRCHGEIHPGDPLPATLNQPEEGDALAQLLWQIDFAIHMWAKHGVPEDIDVLGCYRGLRKIADRATADD